MKHALCIILLFFPSNAFCENFTCENLLIGRKAEIPNSGFYVHSIGSLYNYETKDGYEHYLLFSKNDNSFQIVLDNNVRSFSVYISSIHKNYFIISNNYASGENIITIYKILDKEPYVKKIYQTQEDNKKRVGWDILEWKNDQITLIRKGEERSLKKIKL